MELGHFLSYQIANTLKMPNILWEDELCTSLIYEGRRLTIASLVNCYKNILQEAKDLLYQVHSQ